MIEKINDRIGRKVLGVFIDAIGWQEILVKLIDWATDRQSRYVCQCNVDVIVTSTQDENYKNIINNADLANPDGMPIAWMLRKKGFDKQERIGGPDLMLRLCQLSAEKNISVFFYGSISETLEKLTNNLTNHFPQLEIAGTQSPPFRNLTVEENKEVVKLINSSGAGIVFVGLGCPKQEIWMSQNFGKINAVMIGVGAAFDFHAGTVERSPVWMQKIGLEWFYRLVKEPKRLWKRYLYGNIKFIVKIIPELIQYKLNNNHFASK